MTLEFRAVSKGLLTLLLTLLFFLCFDLLINQVNPFPSYNGWGTGYLQTKLSGLDKHYRKYGRIDVLTMGSSVGQGTEVDKWQYATDNEAVCYNLNVPGFHAENTAFLFMNHIYPKYSPKVLIYVAHPSYMFEGNPSFGERQFFREFWMSAKVRDLMASNVFEKILTRVNSTSYLFQTKRIFRTTVTGGAQKSGLFTPAEQLPIDEFGITGKFTTGVTRVYPNAKNKRLFANLSMAEIKKLAAFCREKNVRFYLVNQDQAPSSWAKFPEGSRALYQSALQRLNVGDGNLCDLSVDPGMSDEDYYDSYHLNSPGQSKVTTWIFNHIVSPALLSPNIKTLGQEEIFPFVGNSLMNNSSFKITRCVKMPYELQMLDDSTSASVEFLKPLAAGRYLVTLYSKMFNRQPYKSAAAEVVLECLDQNETVVKTLRLDVGDAQALNSLASKTVGVLDVPEVVKIRILSENHDTRQQVLLDSIGITPVWNEKKDIANLTQIRHDLRLPLNANLLANADFSFETAPDGKQTISGWYQQSNAELIILEDYSYGVRLVCNDGKRAPLVQYVDSRIVDKIRGKTVRFSYDMRKEGTSILRGTLLCDIKGTTGTTTRRAVAVLDQRSCNDMWSRFTCDYRIPTDASSVTVDLRLGGRGNVYESAIIKNTSLLLLD